MSKNQNITLVKIAHLKILITVEQLGVGTVRKKSVDK